LYPAYLDAVASLDLEAYRAGLIEGDLVVERAGNLVVSYAPFDHVEHDAELVVVGLTPGREQATKALASLAADLRRGLIAEQALANAKRTASFSGPMRPNLLALLDAIGVPALFGRRSAADFFDGPAGLVHFTSALRYPVYLGTRNYSGSPNPLRHPVLRRMIETHLAEEATALPRAVWIPLGGHAEAALAHLARKGLLDQRRVLGGLPHPSGANAERIAYFLGRKSREALSVKTDPIRIDQSKARLLAQIASLRNGR
jgi:hypothetical protein